MPGGILGAAKIRVGPDLSNFQKEAQARLKTVRLEKEVRVKANTFLANKEIDAFIHKPRQAINIAVKVDQKGFREAENSFKRIEHVFKRTAISKAIRINVIVAGAAALPLLTQTALSATTALTELGQAALILPGIFAGVAAAVGTMVLGLKGIGAAFTAAGKSSKDAAQNHRDFTKASRDLERAQRDVGKALRDANRDLEDQGQALRDTFLDQEQAAINVAKAREKLAKGGFDNYTDYRQAVLDVNQALADQVRVNREAGRTVTDANEAIGKGATGADGFRDALDKLASATDNFTKAQEKSTGMADEFTSAMAKLSPAAQDFVNKVRSLEGAFNNLQRVVSQNLLVGVGDSIVALADRRLPQLQASMAGVATSLNGLFKSTIANLGSESNFGFIQKIFSNTAEAIKKMTPGFSAFVDGFLHLAEVGSRFLPRLGDAFTKIGDKFKAFINRADADGSLVRWIDRGLLVINKLFDSIKSIGKILASVADAYEEATGNVGGLATTLSGTLKELADYLGSAKGKKKLVEYIKSGNEFLKSIKDAAGGILDGFQAFSEAARGFAEVAFPIFGAIGRFMSNNIGLVKYLIELYIAFRTVKPFINGLTGGWERLNRSADKYNRTLEKVQKSQAAISGKPYPSDLPTDVNSNGRLNGKIKDDNLFGQAQVQNPFMLALTEQQMKNRKDAARAALDEEERLGKRLDAIRKLDAQSQQNYAQATSNTPAPGDAYISSGKNVSDAIANQTKLLGEQSKLAQTIAKAEQTAAKFNAPVARAAADSAIAKGEAVRFSALVAAEEKKLQSALKTVATISAKPEGEQKNLKSFQTRAANAQANLDELRPQATSATAAHISALRAENAEIKKQAPAVKALNEARVSQLTNDVNLQNAEKNIAVQRSAHAAAIDELNKRQAALNLLRDDATTKSSALVKAEEEFKTAQKNAAVATDAAKNSIRDYNTASANNVIGLKNLREATEAAAGPKGFGFLNRVIGDSAGGKVMGKLVSAIGGAGIGLIGAIGSLWAAIGPTLAISGIIYAFTRWQDVNQEAADAVDRHKQSVDALTESLQASTGASGEASKKQILDRLSDFTNDASGQKYGNLFAKLRGSGTNIDDNQLLTALNNGDTASTNKILDPVKGAAGKELRDYQNSLRDKLVVNSAESAILALDNPEDLALALSGDAGATQRFRDQQALPENVGNFLGDTDLNDILQQLPEGLRSKFQALQGFGTVANDIPQARAQAQGYNYALNGPATLNPAGRNLFGPNADVSAGTGGQATVSVPAAMLGTQDNPTQLAKNILENGNDIAWDKTQDGKFQITLDPKRAPLYVNRGFKRGGPVWGAGDATSDSIPAMLSNGEYVVNAKAVNALGVPTLDRLNAAGGKGSATAVNNHLAPGGQPIPIFPGPIRPLVPTNGPGPTQFPNGAPFFSTQLTPPPRTFPAGTTPGSLLAGQGILNSVPGPTPYSTLDKLHGVSGADISGTADYYKKAYPLGGAPAAPPPAPKPVAPGPAPFNYQADVANTKRILANDGQGREVQGRQPFTGLGPTGPGPLPGPNNGLGQGSGPLPGPSITPIPTLDQLGSYLPAGTILPVGVGNEQGLQLDSIRVKREISAAFPNISDIGGFREDPNYPNEHPAGKALDVMVGQGNPEGNAVKDFALGQPGVEYAIWNGQTWYPDGSSKPYTGPNPHTDHVHVHTAGGGYPTGSEQITSSGYIPPLPGGSVSPLGPGDANPLIGGKGSDSGGSGGNSLFTSLLGGIFPGLAGAGGAGGGDFKPTLEGAVKAAGLDDLPKKLGQIAMQFVGGFLGIDLSQITGPIGKALGDKGSDDSTASQFDNSGQFQEKYASGQLPTQSGSEDERDIAQLLAAAKQAKDQGDDEEAQRLLGVAQQLRARSGGNGQLPGGGPGSEKWRPIVRQLLNQYGPQLGLTDLGGWEQALVRQIQQESGGDPGALNPSDSDGLPAHGLLQYKDATFAAVMPGASITDPVAQILGAIKGAPRNSDGSVNLNAPGAIGAGHGWGPKLARGGPVRGPGTGTSDSIPAMLSKGEYVMRAKAVQHWGEGGLAWMNRFAGGGLNIGTGAAPKLQIPGITSGPTQPPGPLTLNTPPPPPAGPAADAAAAPLSIGTGAAGPAGPGLTPAPAPQGIPFGSAQGATLPNANALVGPAAAAAGLGGQSTQPGATSPNGADGAADPRATLGAQPASTNHLHPGLKAGIEGAASAIGNAAGTAASLGLAATGGGGAAGSAIAAGAQVAGQAVSGIANIVASGLVGTLSGGTTGQGYGAPLVPQQPAQTPVRRVGGDQYNTVNVQNNNDWLAAQKRMDAQRSAGFMNRVPT